MGVIQIHKVEREGSRLVFAFAGWTGKGKTYTAIQFGYGLAGYDASKLGFLDAENRRGSLCADILEKATQPTKDRFLIGDLFAPFSPARYSSAIEEFQAAGVEVLIIDSVTHEWEGSGGCQEIAEAGNPKIPRWDKAKEQHKKFMNKLLQSDMHIICCVRAREKTKPEKRDGKTEFVDYGLQPIQEKNFMFEVTASLMMHDEGRRQEMIKCPEALINVLGRRTGYITADDGKMVRDWVNGAAKLDPTVEKYRNRLISNTEGGVAHIEECWKKTPDPIRSSLGNGFYETLIASARGHEEHTQLGAENVLQGHAPVIAGPAYLAEQNEADAIAAKARQNGASTTARQSPPSAPLVTVIAPPAQKTAEPAPSAPVHKQEPPKQQELVAPVTGVMDSDPIF